MAVSDLAVHTEILGGKVIFEYSQNGIRYFLAQSCSQASLRDFMAIFAERPTFQTETLEIQKLTMSKTMRLQTFQNENYIVQFISKLKPLRSKSFQNEIYKIQNHFKSKAL